jgi:hypothetical protein
VETQSSSETRLGKYPCVAEGEGDGVGLRNTDLSRNKGSESRRMLAVASPVTPFLSTLFLSPRDTPVDRRNKVSRLLSDCKEMEQ